MCQLCNMDNFSALQFPQNEDNNVDLPENIAFKRINLVAVYKAARTIVVIIVIYKCIFYSAFRN